MQLAAGQLSFFWGGRGEDLSACLQNVLVFSSRVVTGNLRFESGRSRIKCAKLRYQHRDVFIDVPSSHGRQVP